MDDFVYLLLNLGTLVSTFFMGKFFKITFSYIQFVKALLLVSLPFIIWDAWAVSAGHWSFNEQYSLGIHIGNLAIEEILFFITVPYAMTVIYLAGAKRIKSKQIDTRLLSTLFFTLGLMLLLRSTSGTYTFTVSLVFLTILVWLILANSKLYKSLWFWQFQLILFTLFLIFNSMLTALPVIEYGAGQYTGFRIGTIPIEDFFYNFALINSFIAVYLTKTNNKPL